MLPESKVVTIRDVAAAAGVSVSTVSRVLNEKDDVAEITQSRVRQIIDELGYASSLAATSMRSRKSNVIGLIMIDLSDPFSIEVVRGVSAAIRDHQYDLIVYSSGRTSVDSGSAWERKSLSRLNGTITDGIIVVTPTTGLPTRSPLVVIDPSESGNIPSVESTNYVGAKAIMTYLTGLGHQRIGYIGGREELLSARERQRGYEEGLRQAGLPVEPSLIQSGDYTRTTGYSAARELLESVSPPTAIFAANDQSAFGVLDAASAMGLNVPTDLSIAGFDNIPESAVTQPPLTTVAQAIQELGSVAVELLIDVIEGNEIEEPERTVPTELIVRGSCQAIEHR